MDEYKGISFELHDFKLFNDTISIFATIDHKDLKQDISLCADLIYLKNNKTINVKSFCYRYGKELKSELYRLTDFLLFLKKTPNNTAIFECQKYDIVCKFLESKICPVLNKILQLTYKKF